MKRIRRALSAFFRPPPGAPRWRRLLPIVTLLGLFVLAGFSGATVWEYTNSPEFCGTTCHTMPPEYTAYLTSPHARILCVECHIGRDFIGSRVLRKAGDIRHIFATAFQTYEFPIRADDMRPARETCERCHSPEKFADDSLREIVHFGSDEVNTRTSIYLTLKTGGGSRRQGLGRGIHWHIENEIYYLALDEGEQSIPYVRVIEDDGTTTEYVDIEADFDVARVDESQLHEMDCITCHNRITHLILPPDDRVDQMLARGLISTKIPGIRAKAVEVMSARYDKVEDALDAIAKLRDDYRNNYPDYFVNGVEDVDAAIAALQEAYRNSTFPEQKADWMTHANNVGHRVTAGCFRCHDGKHMDDQDQAIRLECNLCHSIPVVAGPDKFVVDIEISRGLEPESHLNANWLALHRDAFDVTCSNCHNTANPGGTDNTSFCSNSGCHGTTWQYAGLNAPELRETLKDQLPPPAPTPTPAPAGAEIKLTYNDTIGPLFKQKCSVCHGEDATQGLNLITYSAAMAGSDNGAVIVPGDAEASLLVKKQSGAEAHFGQLTPEELELVIDWINAGAPEK
jgi:nitrate/TMAO reductase-like tetraheme cytochrome c subunit